MSWWWAGDVNAGFMQVEKQLVGLTSCWALRFLLFKRHFHSILLISINRYMHVIVWYLKHFVCIHFIVWSIDQSCLSRLWLHACKQSTNQLFSNIDMWHRIIMNSYSEIIGSLIVILGYHMYYLRKCTSCISSTFTFGVSYYALLPLSLSNILSYFFSTWLDFFTQLRNKCFSTFFFSRHFFCY